MTPEETARLLMEHLLRLTSEVEAELAALRELKEAFQVLYTEHAIHLELASYEERQRRQQQSKSRRGAGGFEVDYGRDGTRCT